MPMDGAGLVIMRRLIILSTSCKLTRSLLLSFGPRYKIASCGSRDGMMTIAYTIVGYLIASDTASLGELYALSKDKALRI